MLPNLTITPAAEKFMRRIVRFSGLPDGAGFRLTVSAGGCSGYNAEFSAEAAPQPGEETLEVNGLRVFLPAESRLMLDGVTMDFADTPTKSGLTFVSPNQAACGCSSSAEAGPPGIAKIDIGAIGRGRPVAPTLIS
ncbi:iron-sulfur cluster assembly accessory protein [Ramlibacter sp. H39-3-26]|uniref:HesB/IscA family protein n=1 Tax=Curvibacter soli TaxID=3031331 RepID=UPI0023DCB113|nr:iron-sulfur cluster assembly accessory protein [Ramlibacter sp. H39-3-26]MDF1484062.1 iron-sulfur cluster assembly accessory protein [Ramlibacter sp. H39-3-26]